MRITPGQTSYPREGPPPVFNLETGGDLYFAVEISTERFLFNGAALWRRSAANFFSSRIGDALFPVHRRPEGEAIAGQRLEAATGFATYQLPQAAWNRLKGADQLFYRLLTSSDARFSKVSASVEDVDWEEASFISISHLPARPTRSPVSRFRGRGALGRGDLLDHARAQTAKGGVVQGRDIDFCYVFLDARLFDLMVVECLSSGLTRTLDAMPLQPDAMINGAFVTGTGGIDTEGEVILDGEVIHSDSQPARQYLAQVGADFSIGTGDPGTQEPSAKTAFGGLGALLTGGAPTAVTPWDQATYDLPSWHGRGAFAIHRGRQLILLIVQRHNPICSENAMTMSQLRTWLAEHGFDDAVFNQGGDSETLFARSGWLIVPAAARDKAMDFAIGLVARGA
jgi:Phosphodiester glycosidase